jgi:branched-chain amino acid transport system ATP-binding protein
VSAILRARNLSAGYGQVLVVHDVDLEVAAGEVVALLGANGVGKTTTLLTLGGELRPLGGEVEWEGSATRDSLSRRARSGLSLVTEERSVFMRLSVRDNLRVGRAPVKDALELFPELAARVDVKAGSLSGGEQQMLTVARALVRRPKVMLIDELSFGLAPLVVERLLAAVRNAAESWGVGVLLVEQRIDAALRYSDRAYVMAAGRIRLAGTADEIRREGVKLEASYLGRTTRD